MEKENQKECPEDISGKDLPDTQEYQKPAFTYETVFETMALSCGKISAGQQQCHFNRKTS